MGINFSATLICICLNCESSSDLNPNIFNEYYPLTDPSTICRESYSDPLLEATISDTTI
jgi:hypothetical protein